MRKARTKKKPQSKKPVKLDGSQLELSGIKSKPVWEKLETLAQAKRAIKREQAIMNWCFSD